jgi:hypothetical protein
LQVASGFRHQTTDSIALFRVASTSPRQRETFMPLAQLKRIALRCTAFAALFMSAQIAVAAEKDQGSAEGATAAAQYKAWNASKDPKAIVAGE